MGVREEEAGIWWPLWIGVGAGGAAARPGIAGAMDHPLLKHGLPLGIDMQRAAVGPPTRYLTLLDRGRGLQGGGRGSTCLGDDRSPFAD